MDFLQLPPPLSLNRLYLRRQGKHDYPPCAQGGNHFRDQETCWRITPEKHQRNNLTLSLAASFAWAGLLFTRRANTSGLWGIRGSGITGVTVMFPCSVVRHSHRCMKWEIVMWSVPFQMCTLQLTPIYCHLLLLSEKLTLELPPYRPYASLSDCVYQFNLHYPVIELIHFICFNQHRFNQN